eukprot:SAG25_NODE_8032_length_444_cov_0.591304_1_plen_39_part_01
MIVHTENLLSSAIQLLLTFAISLSDDEAFAPAFLLFFHP